MSRRCTATTYIHDFEKDPLKQVIPVTEEYGCVVDATHGTLCYYHDKMAEGHITPHVDQEDRATVIDTATGVAIYEPATAVLQKALAVRRQAVSNLNSGWSE